MPGPKPPLPPMPPLPDPLSAINTQGPNDILSAQLRAATDVGAQSAYQSGVQSALDQASFAMWSALAVTSAVSTRTMGIETTYGATGAEGDARVVVNTVGGPAPQPATPATPKGPKR